MTWTSGVWSAGIPEVIEVRWDWEKAFMQAPLKGVRHTSQGIVAIEEVSAAGSLSTLTERVGFGEVAPYAARTPNLPRTARMAEMLENQWIPHVEGITISDKTIRFSDIYRLTEATGIEYGLAREVVNGKAVYRLYSGGANAVTIGASGNDVLRVIGHTHPSGIGRLSRADINNINNAFLDALQGDPYARAPVRILIWGSEPGQTTPYYPRVMR